MQATIENAMPANIACTGWGLLYRQGEILLHHLLAPLVMTNESLPAEPCDVLIEAGYVVPIQPHGIVLEQHAVAVRESVIVGLLPIAEARLRFAPSAHGQPPSSRLITRIGQRTYPQPHDPTTWHGR